MGYREGAGHERGGVPGIQQSDPLTVGLFVGQGPRDRL
jgi:hypothetical protein